MNRGIHIVITAAALVLAGLASTGGAGAAPGAPARSAGPAVEVVFVLDSTGSMGGLIEGAKQKIWSIANSIISRKPTPEVRIGLLAYRDQGDEYVTRAFDLTDDIDAVFQHLQSFRADGGGDDEESVNQALREAVGDMSWTRDRSVLKVVFLVGDYPPHMDYHGDVRYQETCREAVKRDIVINTVQCGSVPETTRVWREVARLAEGSFVALAQSGNMQQVASPYDEEISRLSAEVGGTVVAYGTAEMRREVASKTARAAEAPAAVAADRAAFNLATGGKAVQGSGDLVNDVAAGTVAIERLEEKELPVEMQGMKPADRKAYVAKLQGKRAELNRRLAELSAKRASFIEQEMRKAAGSGDSFDLMVSEIIAAQAERRKR